VRDELINIGKTGEESWLAVISQIRDTAEVFEPGLSAAADFEGALEKIIASGGRGQSAISGLVAIAVESGEAGISTLDQLRQRLVEGGKFSALEIESLFRALAQAGVSSFEEIRNLSDQELGGIIAAMDAFFQDNGVQWADLAENIKGANEPLSDTVEKLASLDGSTSTHKLIIEQEVTGDAVPESVSAPIESRLGNVFNNGFLKTFARGGVVRRKSFFKLGGGIGSIAENSPEAIMPLERINGKLGVNASGSRGGGGVQINIMAQGAAPGVREEIISMIPEIEDSIGQTVMHALQGIL